MGVIVVADDDGDIRDLVTYRLERDGHDVVSVSDGNAAVKAVIEHRADLAVLDVMMPGLSGFEAARAIRAADGGPVGIILLTARAQEDDVELGYAAGVDDYVTKPFSPRELSFRVTALLARGQ